MVIVKQPFRTYDLNSKKSEIMTVRLNEKERTWLDQLKQDLNMKSDSKALKHAAKVGANVIHVMFDDEVRTHVYNPERAKYGD